MRKTDKTKTRRAFASKAARMPYFGRMQARQHATRSLMLAVTRFQSRAMERE
jgi:hypothetical protein